MFLGLVLLHKSWQGTKRPIPDKMVMICQFGVWGLNKKTGVQVIEEAFQDKQFKFLQRNSFCKKIVFSFSRKLWQGPNFRSHFLENLEHVQLTHFYRKLVFSENGKVPNFFAKTTVLWEKVVQICTKFSRKIESHRKIFGAFLFETT